MKPEYSFRPFNVTLVKSCGLKCPKPRSGHRIVADEGNIYSFGGYNPQMDHDMDDENMPDFIWVQNCILFKELWKFNIATSTWTKMRTTGNMPEELASHSAVLFGDNLFAFGGTGVPFGHSSSNTVHICNLKSLEWFQLPVTGQPPLEQYGQAVALSQSKLYVVGGTTGFQYSMNVHCLNLKTSDWFELCTSNMPEPRYRHEIVVKDEKLFVFGGGTATSTFSLKEIPVFNLSGMQNGSYLWTELSTSEDHPVSRKCHSCVQMDDDVYISGGYDGIRILEDMWKINLETLQWKKLPCIIPQPVYFHSATLTPEGQMFIFGGATSIEDNTRTNELYSVWLKIPSLKEITWNAILYYIPHIGQMERSDLSCAGIPRTLLDRVDFNGSKIRPRSRLRVLHSTKEKL